MSSSLIRDAGLKMREVVYLMERSVEEDGTCPEKQGILDLSRVLESKIRASILTRD